MATDTDANLLNRIFDGRYLILRRLGSGGMAEVYLAEDQELGRKVALKMLNERHARDEQFVERFKREARNAAGLSHPHIVRIYDRGQAEGTYYIAMEYLDGYTLKELLTRKGPTPPLTAVKFAREILSALAEAHRHEIVHRDIKPHNVIVSPNWQIKVTDFGIARSGASQMTEVGSIVGTAQYLSPEQARGAPVDQRSDLYSLGIVLYEMLTGTVPFTGDAAVEIAMKHLTAIPDPPSKLRPEIPHELDAVVMRALAKDPAQRYSSAEEMDADLARVARGVAVSPKTEEAMTQVLGGAGLASAVTTIAHDPPANAAPAPPNYRPASLRRDPTPRRSRWPLVLALLAVVIAAAGAYLIYEHVAPQLSGPKTVVVPNVLGVQYQLAEQQLKSYHLSYRVHNEPDASVTKGAVIKQVPASGNRVKTNATVVLDVSTGIPQATIPPLTGQTRAAAEDELASEHLKYAVHYNPSTTVPAGTVTAAAPKPGTSVPVGSVVRINVSSGPPQAAVPSVVGQQYPSAASALQGAGFVPVKVTAPGSAPVGQVTGETPSAGTLEPPHTKVQLTVSSGPQPVTVPSVINDDAQDAAQILSQQGFIVVQNSEAVTVPTQNDIVLNQNPPAGTTKPAGTTVTITVGQLVTSTPPTTTQSTSTTPTTSTATTTPATTTPPPATTSSLPATTQTTPATTTTAVTTPTTPTAP